MIQEDIEGHQ